MIRTGRGRRRGLIDYSRRTHVGTTAPARVKIASGPFSLISHPDTVLRQETVLCSGQLAP